MSEHFRRIHFFQGFFTTEDDWNESVRYHVEKRKLHNRYFHAPGVVPGHGDQLRVNSRGRGDLSVEIGAGYAIDTEGNDILVPEKQIRTIDRSDFKLPQTIYLVLRYTEDQVDFRVNKRNPDYQGHARIEEGYKLEFTNSEPTSEVEVCRVLLEKNAKRITDARDPLNPQENEIDLRFVRHAGVAGARLTPMLMWRLAEVITEQKRVLSHLARVKKILSAGDAFHAVLTLEMLLKTAFVDHANIWDLLLTVTDLEGELVDEVDSRVPDLSAADEFRAFKKNIEILRGLVGERRRTDEGLENVITYQMKACEALTALLDVVRPEEINVQAMDGAAITGAILEGSIAFEDIKVRSEPFGETLVVDGKEWKLVDMIDMLDSDSESAHDFAIREAKDTYRTRQKLRYPDGTVIEDKGIAHEGGWCEFRIKNLTPHQDLVMVRRMDYVHGDYQAEVHVNNQRLDRILDCKGEDRKYRWRNWPFVIPAQHISTESIHVKQVLLTADRDINMFRFWFYQPK